VILLKNARRLSIKTLWRKLMAYNVIKIEKGGDVEYDVFCEVCGHWFEATATVLNAKDSRNPARSMPARARLDSPEDFHEFHENRDAECVCHGCKADQRPALVDEDGNGVFEPGEQPGVIEED
jgi:hypothetical protein